MRVPIAGLVIVLTLTTPVLADNSEFDNYVSQLYQSGYISPSTSTKPTPISVTYKDNYGNSIPLDVYLYYTGYPLTSPTQTGTLSDTITNVGNLSEMLGWLVTTSIQVPPQYQTAYTYFKNLYNQVVSKLSNVKNALNELMKIGNIGTLNVECFNLTIELHLSGPPTVANKNALPHVLQQLVSNQTQFVKLTFKLMYPEAHIFLSFGLKKFVDMFDIPVKVVYRYDYPDLSQETYAQISLSNQGNGEFTITVSDSAQSGSQTNNVFNTIIIDGYLTISEPSDLNVVSTISNDINSGDLSDAVKAASQYIKVVNKYSFPVIPPQSSQTVNLQGYPLYANKGAAIVICPVAANFIQGYIVDKIKNWLSQENVKQVIPVTAGGVTVNVTVQSETGELDVSGTAPGGVLLLIGPGTPYDIPLPGAVTGKTLPLTTAAQDLDVSLPSTANLVQPVLGTVTPIYVPDLQASTPAKIPVKTPLSTLLFPVALLISATAVRREVASPA